jgi:hypothetical protein
VARRILEKDGLGDLGFEVVGAAVFGTGGANQGWEAGFYCEWRLRGVCWCCGASLELDLSLAIVDLIHT